MLIIIMPITTPRPDTFQREGGEVGDCSTCNTGREQILNYLYIYFVHMDESDFTHGQLDIAQSRFQCVFLHLGRRGKHARAHTHTHTRTERG